MKLSPIIETNHERCDGCRKCVSVCPSPLANFVRTLDDGRQVIEIDNNKCIACGACVAACDHGGRDYNDDTEKFFRDLGDRKIIIIAHPAVKAAFGTKWQALLRWFQQNGADGIYDGAFGADIASWMYCKNIENGTSKNVISNHCPAAVRYMEVYHPDAMDSVAPIHSPMSCEAVYVRDFIKKSYAVAVLSPCPAMSLEFAETSHVEYNVTYKRLREYFRRKRIEFKDISNGSMLYDFDDMSQGQLGGLYAYPGGMRESIAVNEPSAIIASSDGKGCYKDMDEFVNENLPEDKIRPDVLEVLTCAGGCGFGIGAFDDDDATALDIKTMRRRVEIDARSRRKTNLTGTDRNFKLFDDRINPRSVVRKYIDLPDKPTFDDISRRKAALEKFFTAKEQAEAPAAAPVTETVPAPAPEPQPADNELIAKVAQSAVGVKKLTDKVADDVRSLRDTLNNLGSTNTQAISMSEKIEDILSKVIALCRANDSLDEESLPQLVMILDKLQNAVSTLKGNLTDNRSTGAVVEDSASKTADIADELQQAVNGLILAVADR